MLEYVKGDFFDYEADIRINTVNCVGVMGAGVALEFKNKYPQMFKEYKKICQNKEIEPGKPFVWEERDLFSSCIIINFPTKVDWRRPSKYEYIELGLKWLKDYLLNNADSSTKVTLPALGCGHGGLDWSSVRAMIDDYLGDLDCHIYVFPPASSNHRLDTDYYKDQLEKKNAKLITCESDKYPEKIRDATRENLYIRGNEELLAMPKLGLVFADVKNDFEKEKRALYSILEELDSKEYAILISVANKNEEALVCELLENAYSVIAFISCGILAKEYRAWDHYYDKNFLVCSFVSPDSPYKRMRYDLMRIMGSMSSAMLLCASNLDAISESWKFISPVMEGGKILFYIKFWSGVVPAFEQCNMQAIAIDKETKRPNVKTLYNEIIQENY